MGFMPKKVEREDLKPGDHIYVFRPCYTQHGIYEDDEGGKVIHLTRGESRDTLNKSPFHPSEGLVVRCTLDEFLSGGEPYRFEYGVNPLYFLTKLWGTCTCACSDPVEDVLDRATSLLTDESHCKTDCFGDYDLTNNNCEDFALYCKTGLLDVKGSRRTGSSGQVALFVAVITAVYAYIFMPYGFLPTSITGIALVFCFFICNSRLHFDAGSRNSYLLKKVSVEEFKQLSSPDVAWMELGTKWIVLLAVLAFVAWYWTPKSMILLCVRSFLLYVLLSLLVIGYLRNHRFKLYVYVWNNLVALTLWHWTPESNDFQGIRRLLLLAAIDKLVINPMINRSSQLLQFIEETVFLSVIWYWNPESTILQWVRLFFLITTILWAVNKTRNRCSKPLIYVLDCISVLVVWCWTPDPEGINYQWIRLFLLNVSVCQLVANLRNHRLLSSVCIVNFILALALWNWSPERTIVLWIRSLLICGLPILFVIDPYFPFKLANLDTPWLLGLWWWTPESTVLSWIRLFLLAVLLLRLVGRIYLFLVPAGMG